jgi:hypothetical protein
MKKQLILSLLLLSRFNFTVSAQGIPVIDVAHIAMTVANGTVLNDQLGKLSEQVGVSYLIQQKVSEIYTLQHDYQEFLRQAESVRDLSWADLSQSQAHSRALETSMDAYVPAYDQIASLKQAYQDSEGRQGAVSLYQQLDGFGAETTLPADLLVLENSLADLSVNRAAFDEMAFKKKLQVALSYNQLAEDLLEKARELSQALLINERFSMTEGERLISIKQAHALILESMDLKLQADALVLEVMQAAETSKAAPLRNYQQQLEREVISATSLF